MNDGNKISEHTIKKFDLVAGYVASWIHKLMVKKLYSLIVCAIMGFIRIVVIL